MAERGSEARKELEDNLSIISDSRSLSSAQKENKAVDFAWLLAGIACPLTFLATTSSGDFRVEVAPVLVYVLAILALDILVSFSSSYAASQRVTPAIVLALLLTPGLPLTYAVAVDLLAVISIAAIFSDKKQIVAQVGKACLPATLTAFYLRSQVADDLNSQLIACQVFLVLSLITHTSRPPFRADIFVVISYPAVALLLRNLTGLGFVYLVIALPLLFLLTTVETGNLKRYFSLKKELADSKLAIRKSKRAQRQTELESRHKGELLLRKEQQLTLLNGLGSKMEEAEAAEDLGYFLLKEASRLAGASISILVFFDLGSQKVVRVLSHFSKELWGLAEGDLLPSGLGRIGIYDNAPWPAPLWRGQNSFLTCRIGQEGLLILAQPEKNAFPEFLDDFFTAVGRQAGSAVLALRRLVEVRAIARREAQEKENVALEKEKVAEQNRNLRFLIDSFEGLAAEALSSDQELYSKAARALARITRAERLFFRAGPLESYPRSPNGIKFEDKQWASFIYLPGEGVSGSLLCLSQEPNAFKQGDIEWCSLLQDFLDKTVENNGLHLELKQSYDKLKRSQQEVVLSSQWAAAGRLAANAAHELNTPLGAVRIAAEHIGMYLKKGGKVEPALESMASLMNSVDKCRRVTDRLLLTSRPADQGSASFDPVVQDLSLVIKDAVVSMSTYIRAVKVKLVMPDPLPPLRAKIVMQDLYWALVNLLRNSIDAINDAKQAEKIIAIGLKEGTEFIEIAVRDSGTGLAPEAKAHLFEPFFTTKKIGQGNGLGLSMSRSNLRRWGGDLEYRERQDGGATFVVKLPRG